MDVINEYKYLGVLVNRNLYFNKHIEYVIKQIAEKQIYLHEFQIGIV